MIEEVKKMLEPKSVKALKELLSQYPDDALVSFIVPSNDGNQIDDNAWTASYRKDEANEFRTEGEVKAIEIPLYWDKDEGPFDSCDYDNEPQTSF